jgi:hypothetical protein
LGSANGAPSEERHSRMPPSRFGRTGALAFGVAGRLACHVGVELLRGGAPEGSLKPRLSARQKDS